MIAIEPFKAIATRDVAGGVERYPVEVVGVTRENDHEAQLVVLVRNGTHAYAAFVNDVELIRPLDIRSKRPN